MIDSILNNLAAFRTTPLYVDLDRLAALDQGDELRFGMLSSDAGQVIKTHFPAIPRPQLNDDLMRIIDTSIAVTVRRDFDHIKRSLQVWGTTQSEIDELAVRYSEFWRFWVARDTIKLMFDDLFSQETLAAAVEQ